MVGGKEAAFEQAKEIFECISYKYQHIGPIGSGQIMKAINQAYLANAMASDAELIEFAVKANIDPALISTLLGFPIRQAMLDEDYAGKNNLVMHYKDLGYFLEIAHENCASIPISSLVHEIFKSSKLYCDPTWAQVGIRTFYQRVNEEKHEKRQD